MPDYRALVRRQDEHFLSFASGLSDDDWAVPSLCHGWSNKDVLAHLALGLHVPTVRLVLGVVRYRSFDMANDLLSRRYADEHTAAELLDVFDMFRRHPKGVGTVLPAPLMLGDHTVHHLDIAHALRRPADLDSDVANAVLHVETTIPNPLIPAKARSRGLRLVTRDTAWTSGPADGPLVRGPAAALISALAGRSPGLHELTGPGQTVLAARLG